MRAPTDANQLFLSLIQALRHIAFLSILWYGSPMININSEKLTFVAPCLFGLESVLAFEVGRIGGENITATDGRVMFKGGSELLVRANLRLRCAERVCILLGSFEAHTFQQLIDESEKIAFEDFIGANDAFPVAGWTIKSKLFSMSSCQSIIKKAAVNRLMKTYRRQILPETGPVHQIRFSIMKDNVDIMLDTSGTGLHKRGYRTEAGEAPLKETLAAGIIDLARVREDSTVIDPMCGSGTLLCESAMRAMNIAPGLLRQFSAERWGLIPESIWREERERARSEINRNVQFRGIGYDIDPDVLEIARENAKRAGAGECISFEKRDISDFNADSRATIVCNPPYGERLLEDANAAQKLYRDMGKVMKKMDGMRYYIIGPEGFEKAFGRKADRRRKLYNGMIQCHLYMYFK